MLTNPGSRELELVELVDTAGRALGAATVAAAHRPPGTMHRAFSVMLVDHYGRALIQRRAAVKTRFPLRWSNTCCGHPAPGADVCAEAERRLAEELGIRGVRLTELGVHVYQARDEATQRAEHEFDHILAGQLDPDHRLTPDPAEVAAVRWVDLEALRPDLGTRPGRYTPWLAGVVDHLPPGTLPTRLRRLPSGPPSGPRPAPAP